MRMPGDVFANKKVAFVSNNAWSVYNFRLDVIRWLIDAKCRVVVLSPPDPYTQKLIDEGCEFIPLQFSNKGENPLSDLRLYLRLKKLYGSLNPHFIFHYVAKPNIYGSMAAAANHIPCVAVITGLGYPFAKRDLLFHIMRLLYKQSLKKVYEVWFLNNDDAKVFISEAMADISRVRILPGEGINTDYFRTIPKVGRTDESFEFLMCTRLLKSKGIGIYADAARILRKKNYPHVRFNLVGFFEENHPDSISQEDLDRWQREKLIHYLGFADDVRPYLEQSDCVVFPSYYNEGVPRCLMEAASMERPAITSRNRGCTEVVEDGVNGYLCNLNDPFDLADKMEKMMNLPQEIRTRMGSRGRELVIQKFDVRKIIQEYANTLISAFESPGDLHPTPEKTKKSG